VRYHHAGLATERIHHLIKLGPHPWVSGDKEAPANRGGRCHGGGKTLLRLRNLDHLPAGNQLRGPVTNSFLVTAPPPAILASWPQQAHKLGLAHSLDHLAFITYRPLNKALAAGTYPKLYLATLRMQALVKYPGKGH
jgi:hypothetical protein